jgi:exopolysaccharide biosynthesis WecB/TagA/CpsF family protein
MLFMLLISASITGSEGLNTLDHYSKIRWPSKHSLLGVNVSVTDYNQAERLIILAAIQRTSAIVTHLPVHGIVLACNDHELNSMVGTFEIAAPDGQPVRWALNSLYGTNLRDRVYGPELMLRLCRRAAAEGIAIYLYGSYPQIVERLRARLLKECLSLKVVGCESPPFRRLTSKEDQAAVERINSSGAGLVFLGLGCPLQDIFAYEHRHSIKAIQLCVGAAFDFLAGSKKTAPKWMQKSGFEWLYRLMQEPGRLWRRYFITNSIFLWKLSGEIIKRKLLHIS